jgi:hypothetical protein
MKTIKRNIPKVFLIPILTIIFTSILGIFGIKLFLKEMNNKDTINNPVFYISFAACFVLIFIGYYELKKRLEKVPEIKISEDFLIIDKHKHQLNEINEVNLTGKYYFNSGGRYKIKELMFREGMEIKLMNGKILHFYDEFYNNLNDLKLILEKKLNLEQTLNNPTYNNTESIYRNIQFFKLRGFIVWSIIIYLLINNFFLNENINTNGLIFTVLVCLFLFIWQSKFMHYFIFSNKELTIKNENLLWTNHNFELNEIREVIFEKDVMIYDILKRKHLRIILKNHKQYKYGADLLRKSMWNNLKNDFKKLGIKVRDEF